MFGIDAAGFIDTRWVLILVFLVLQVADLLTQPIAEYFDKVFVMSEDAAVRQSRLALLRDIANLTGGIIDFAELPGF